MSSLKNAVFFLLLVNTLAFIGLLGWLVTSKRLNVDRARQIRAMLTPTIAQQAAAEAELAGKEQTQQKQEAEKVRRVGVPESAAERLESSRDARDLIEQDRLRAREEVRQLRAILDTKRAELDVVNKQITDAQAALALARQEFAQSVGDEQFEQAVATLQAQKPKDAAAMLRSILDEPAPAQQEVAGHVRNQRSLVVKYLSAMDERARNRVLAEFVKVDPKLAAELLEAIRQRGGATAAAGAPLP